VGLTKALKGLFKVQYSDSIFKPIWTFDSKLERKSLFLARQKSVFWDFRIFKILISRHIAFNQNFEKPGFWLAGKSDSIS